MAMLGLALAACMAPSPSPTILASAPPVGPTTTPAPSASVLVECLDATYPPPPRSPPPGYVGGNFCTIALPVVLAALAGQPGVPILVVFDAGIYCPTPGLLFPGTSCPGGSIPPSPGGQSLGHALVSFAGTSMQAYLNLWAYPISGAAVTAQLIAVASAPPSSMPSSPAPSSATRLVCGRLGRTDCLQIQALVDHQFPWAAGATALVMDYTCQPGQHCTVYFDAIVSILIPQDPATDYAYWPPTYRVSGIAGPETLSPWVGPLPATFDTLLRSAGFAG